MPEAETVSKDQLIFLQRKRKTGNNEFHIVQPGETLHDIAQEEALRTESLLEYNFLNIAMKPAIGEQLNLRTKASQAPKLLLKENYSLVPVNAKAAGMSPAPTNNFLTCTVQPKETIYSIARKYNVKIADIVKWNQLDGYDLKKGQQLKIYK
jgi:LysM repeat protein